MQQAKKMWLIIAVFLPAFFNSCNDVEKKKSGAAFIIDRANVPEEYYYTDAKLIRTYDTMWIYNSSMDTVIIDTGIFSKLIYDFPLYVDSMVLNSTRQALEYEKHHEPEKALKLYRKITEDYNSNFPPPIPTGDMADMDSYERYTGNSAMLYSYALEKTGNLDEAIEALRPYMVELDLQQIRTRERYIELLIKKLGKDRVLSELDNCGKTVYCKKDNFNYCDWIINVFGADVYLASSLDYKEMNPERASLIVRQQDFYKLIQSPLRYREVY